MPTAIAERPLLGWGSWATDVNSRFAIMRGERLGTVRYDQFEGIEDGLIAFHSIIGAAWLWSGVVGFIAILLLFRIVLGMFVEMPKSRSFFLPVLLYFLISTFWNILFNPPQTVRLHFPIALGALIAMQHRNFLHLSDRRRL